MSKWDHFDILASGKTDYHCKVKETLFIQGLQPGLNANPGAIIGDGDRKRAISSTGVVPMIWDNNSIFRTNCTIAWGTRACMLRGFLRMSRGEMASQIPQIFHAFGSQLNAFASIGILLKYFRRKVLQFEWSKTVSNLGMFRFKLRYVSLTKLCSDGCFFYMSCTLLHFKFHICWRLTALKITQQNTSWIYLDIAELQDVIVS